MTDYSVKRDYWDRPFVTTDGGPLKFEAGRKSPVNARAYSRASGAGKVLDDSSGLVDWAACSAAVGVVRDPGIMAGVSALASQHADPWNVPAAKKPLKELVKRARERGGGSQAADIGTAYHTYTELVDSGSKPPFMPEPFPGLVAEYERCITDHGLEVVATELFVVCDELELAGSLDKLVRLPDGAVVVCDLKSGKHDAGYPMGVTIQTAVYANSVRYDQESGKRAALHPDLDMSRTLLLHHPVRTKGSKCTPYVLDAARGFDLAKLADRVKAETKFDKLVPM